MRVPPIRQVLRIALPGMLAAAPLAAQTRTDTSFAVGAGGIVHIDSHDGRVHVRGGSGARVHVRASHPSRVRIDVRHAGDGVRVVAEGSRGPARDVDLDIVVPRGWGVNIDGNSIRIVVENVDGDVNASTVQSDMVVGGVRGADLETVQGGVRLRGVRGRVRVDITNGDADIGDVIGELTVSTINGSIALTDIDAPAVLASTVNGRLHFGGPIRDDGDYRLATHNGDIRIAVPAAAHADVTVATHSGSIEADFPVQVRGAVTRRGELSFRIGNGGARLRVESFNGDIRLVRIR